MNNIIHHKLDILQTILGFSQVNRSKNNRTMMSVFSAVIKKEYLDKDIRLWEPIDGKNIIKNTYYELSALSKYIKRIGLLGINELRHLMPIWKQAISNGSIAVWTN